MINAPVVNATPSSAPVALEMSERGNNDAPSQAGSTDSSINEAAENIVIFGGLGGIALSGIGPFLAAANHVILGGVLSGLSVVCCAVACYTEQTADLPDPNNPFPNSD